MIDPKDMPKIQEVLGNVFDRSNFWTPLPVTYFVINGEDHRIMALQSVDTLEAHIADVTKRNPGSATIVVTNGGDMLHQAIPDGFLSQVFEIMRGSQHNFVIQTRYPERLKGKNWCVCEGPDQYAKNIFIGGSISTQEDALSIIPRLLQAPCAGACRFVIVSANPDTDIHFRHMPVMDLEPMTTTVADYFNALTGEGLDWQTGKPNWAGYPHLAAVVKIETPESNPTVTENIQKACEDSGISFFKHFVKDGVEK